MLRSKFKPWAAPYPEHQCSVFHKIKNVGKEISSNFKTLQPPYSLSNPNEPGQVEQKLLEKTFSQNGWKSLIN